MSNDKIMAMLNEKSQPEYYRFVAEDDEKCCDDCKEHNDKIFQENDPDIPKLPIHPNCRCKLVKLEVEETENVKSNILQMIDELNYYENQLLSDFQQWKNDADTLLNSVQNSYNDFVTEAKIKALAATASAMLTMIEKFQNTDNLLEKMVIKFINNYVKPQNIIDLIHAKKDIENILENLKKQHYNRLNLSLQQLNELPRSPEEAIAKGYTKATYFENRYHVNNGMWSNEKYINRVTGQEVIFDRYGNIVTSPENIGTFNYGTDPNSKEHFYYDVLPYWIWGNSENDTTPFLYRLIGKHHIPSLVDYVIQKY